MLPALVSISGYVATSRSFQSSSLFNVASNVLILPFKPFLEKLLQLVSEGPAASSCLIYNVQHVHHSIVFDDILTQRDWDGELWSAGTGND